MKWALEWSEKSLKQLRKLDKNAALIIAGWMSKHIDGCIDPRAHGKALKGNLGGFWRYRVGDYRIICDIQDERLVVLTLEVAHRKDVYRAT